MLGLFGAFYGFMVAMVHWPAITLGIIAFGAMTAIAYAIGGGNPY